MLAIRFLLTCLKVCLSLSDERHPYRQIPRSRFTERRTDASEQQNTRNLCGTHWNH